MTRLPRAFNLDANRGQGRFHCLIHRYNVKIRLQFVPSVMEKDIIQLIVLMNQIVSYVVETNIPWPNVLLTCKETHQVKQVDLMFDVSAIQTMSD